MSIATFCGFLPVLILIGTLLPHGAALGSESEAVSAISIAEEIVVSAYQAIRDAETAGADISGFSVLLQDAAQLLAHAHNSFNVGDFETAIRFANLTSEIGKEIEARALQLRDFQRGFPARQMWLTIVQSIFTVFLVVFMGFWCWRVFKRLYNRRIHGMRPEVA